MLQHSQGEPMSVYYIAEHIITDPVKFEEYRVKPVRDGVDCRPI